MSGRQRDHRGGLAATKHDRTGQTSDAQQALACARRYAFILRYNVGSERPDLRVKGFSLRCTLNFLLTGGSPLGDVGAYPVAGSDPSR
jgi:hypothetical protein